MKVLTMLVATAAMSATFAPLGESVLECTDVTQYVSPCIPYVTQNGPLGTCCDGIQGLFNAAQTTPDRQSVCNCFKSVTSGYSSAEADNAAGLPTQCGINIPYKLSPSTDCSK